MSAIFHLAFNVTNLAQARAFYVDVLGCQEGRSTETWLDIDFFGHQLSLHLGDPWPTKNSGKVGEHLVPMPHFGAILELAEFTAVAAQLNAAKVAFVIAPTVRFAGEAGEQHTMFFLDPFGNPIEFKAFPDRSKVFAV